jgi:A/G-specific adenine glycosylase
MDAQIEQFREQVWAYYAASGRHDLPWRLTDRAGRLDAYHVMVSEIMLQQTQVPRVMPKFAEFLTAFPDVHALANAPLEAVLRAWSGLGYNRRAKFLWQAAKDIVRLHQSHVPQSQDALVALPGIGANTAGAIRAYAFNQPVVFLETNIRTVFIHHFFSDGDKIADAELAPLVAAALDHESPREWYWALMDYGTYLKQTVGNASRASNVYLKQSTFQGSRRQIRGQVLKALGETPQTQAQLAAAIADDRLPGVLHDLLQEGMISELDNSYRLGSA